MPIIEIDGKRDHAGDEEQQQADGIQCNDLRIESPRRLPFSLGPKDCSATGDR